MAVYLRLLRRNPGYARLWLAQAISLLGDWFNTIVLSVLVVAYSPDSTRGMAVSGLLLARFLPPLLLSPLAGVLVDRFDRRRILIVSDVLRTVVVLGFLLVDGPERLWLIYALTVLQFGLSSVFEPGRSALLPSVCLPDDLVPANTLGSITWSVMLAGGAVIGGLVASAVGTSTALIVDALSFLLSAILIAQIRVRAPALHAVEQIAEPKATFRDGLRYLAAHPNTALSALIKLGGSIGNIDLLVIVYATSYFVVGEDGIISLGILWSGFGLGAVLGPLLLNRLNDGTVRVMRRLIIIGYAWISLGWLLFGAAPTLPLATLALAVKAMGSSVYWTYSSVILQKSVPANYLGRVFSVDMAGFQLATVLSTVIVGALVDTLGTDHARLIAYGSVVASLVPLALWVVAVQWMERREPAVSVA